MGQVFISNTYPENYINAAIESQNKNDLKTKSRYWLSKPRSKNSDVWERLTYEFADRSPISSISFDLLSVGAEYEIWYYSSDGSRLPLLRDDYNQIRFTVQSKENWQDWVHWSFNCLACTAVKLEFDMRRVNDDLAPDVDYSLGLRKLAIKRSITDRSDAMIGLRPSTDILGNKISKTVLDWGAQNVIDGSTKTFWKSEPQISQDAVVSLYLDVRDRYGQGQYFDSISIDPVYSGSQMNIYYSNDDSVGNRLASFDAYESEFSDVTYEDGQGYQFSRDERSFISFNDVKTQIDGSGSWMMGIDWWPTSQITDERTIMYVGDMCKLVAKNNGIEFIYYVDGEQHVLRQDLPLPIRYNRPNILSERMNSQVIIEFGIQRDEEVTARLRVRVINTYEQSGKVDGDKISQTEEQMSLQVSELADGVNDDTSIPDGSSVKISRADREIVIPPHSSYEISVDTSKLIIPDGADRSISIDVSLDYYTDPQYVEDGRITVSSQTGGDSVTWWRGHADQSPSSLSVNDVLIATNEFLNPRFVAGGAWLPEKVDNDGDARLENGSLIIHGNTKVRSLTRPPYSIRPLTSYTFSAIPTFQSGTTFSKPYKLFVFDGKTEQYWSIQPIDVESGKRCEVTFTTPEDTGLLSFGFTGGSDDDDVVTWSKPVLCRSSQWDEMKRRGIDFFSGESSADIDAMNVIRYNQELNLNSRNDDDGPLMGDVIYPQWAIDRPFSGDPVLMNSTGNQYDVNSYIWIKGGSSFEFSFYAKSQSGFSKIQPYIVDSAGNRYFCDRYETNDVDYGWKLVYARVAIPNNHVTEMAQFGLLDQNPILRTVIGDLHVYDNAIAFQNVKKYTTMKMSSRADSGNMRYVRIDNMSDFGSIHLSKMSILLNRGDVSDVIGDDVKIQSLGGTLSGLVFKQERIEPDITMDRFIHSPKIYVSPDTYDASSTLTNSLVYGRFYYESVLRGGVSDSMYDPKVWYPALTAQKLKRDRYVIPAPVSAKYIKLEFTQLTAIQYPIENEDAVMEYRVYPVDVTREMLQHAALDQSLRNGKTSSDTSSNTQMLSDSVKQMFSGISASNRTVSANTQSDMYNNPDLEIENTKIPQTWAPNAAGAIGYQIVPEATSSALYTGNVNYAASMSFSSSRGALEDLNKASAEQWVYTAMHNESLISLARRFGLTDWKLLMDSNIYLDDTPSRQSLPGRIPGWWILPGQQVTIPSQQMRQILSTSKVDVVRRTSTSTALTTISDNRPATPETSVVGPKFFGRGSVHYYETRRAKRTQSIAYVVGIREMSVRIVNLLSERDDRAVNFYSMGMPIWHLSHCYLTDQNICVPDFSSGADVATAETDLIAFQSYFRTIKVISTNRDSLVNRRYLPFEGEPWHGPEYWDIHPELNCVWDDSTPDDPRVEEDNGGAWDSNRFAWGQSWIRGTISGKEETIWYDGELVRHIVLGPEDRRFDENGNQIPYTFLLGTTHIPMNAMTSIGASLYSLKAANPDHPDQMVETRIQLATGQNFDQMKIDEEVHFDDRIITTWQNVSSSRYALHEMNWDCQVFLTFNNWERLDVYIRYGYVETGTTRVLAKNVDSPGDNDYEDITSIIGRNDSEYTFKQTGHHLQIKIEMTDPQDWFSSMIVIPIFAPEEDAVFLEQDVIRSIDIMNIDGTPAPHQIDMRTELNLGAKITYLSGRTSGPTAEGFEWRSSHTGIITVDQNGVVRPVTVMGTATVTASKSGVTSEPFQITTVLHD